MPTFFVTSMLFIGILPDRRLTTDLNLYEVYVEGLR